jgi:hypothetical protein
MAYSEYNKNYLFLNLFVRIFTIDRQRVEAA